MRTFLTFGCCLALAFVSTTGGRSHAAELKVGDTAPAFKLPGSDGKPHQLSDFKGKQVVVIAWYPKAFTGGWTAQCKSLRESGDALRKFNVAYFAASCDTLEVNTKFAKSLDLDYPILSDPSKKVATAYGVVNAKRSLPFRWTFYIGADGVILHIDKKVKAGSHGKDVAKQLKKLGVETAK